MMILAAFTLFSASAALLSGRQQRPQMFCGNPDDRNYTLVQDVGQPGITLETVYGEKLPRWFMIYQNGIDYKPYRAMRMVSNTTVFIDLTTTCKTFAGRLVRGADINFDGRAHNLGTWTEINWEDYPSIYGGVSVIEGNDGPVLLQSEDKGAPLMGFSDDIVPIAPRPCKILKDSGGIALKPTDKDGHDKETRQYTMRILDAQRVSIHQNHTATVMSHNGRFRVTFLYGYH
ncbi:hypothetical protein FZEAL_7852 [Fusarium zealandicum]|uniref:Uncharacterized protein n=1 Tax=Fusarium zealandicum TaxID=1053134 RepID=A0A8H4XHG1_9HYPO|nr:hypothetical protein FZEAL_7852 [Fusarium zealandicum]